MGFLSTIIMMSRGGDHIVIISAVIAKRGGDIRLSPCADFLWNANGRWLHAFVLPLAPAAANLLVPDQTQASRGSHAERAAACRAHGIRRTCVWRRVQVQYPMRTGRWLHALALPLALAAVSLLPHYKSGSGRWALCGKGLALWAAAPLACIALPACLGAARVAMTGERRHQADRLKV